MPDNEMRTHCRTCGELTGVIDLRDPCPIVPDAVPVGSAVEHESAGDVKWCWCSRCRAVARTL